MSRILIVTAYYHPFIHPRAHRWTALAEYWTAQGHTVEVVTARHKGFPREGVEQGVTVHRHGFDSLKEWVYYYGRITRARGRVGAPVGAPGPVMGIFEWLYRKVWKWISFPDDAGIWYVPAKKKVLQLLERQAFDRIITVSLPFTGHLIGLAAKRRFQNLHWLADIGDPFSVPETKGIFPGKKRKSERRVLEQADTIAVTTPATRELYETSFGPAAIRNMIVIPPLLHPFTANPNTQTHKHANTQTRQITLGYFGALYAPMRTPDALLALLEQTFLHRPELRERLEIHFYGDIFPEFYQSLSRQPAIILHGLRPRAEVRSAMEQVDGLLHIGNATPNQLPSKAVDYLAAGRPVVHLARVENDAFVRFWGTAPRLFVLPTGPGQLPPDTLERWIHWLEKAPDEPSFDRRDLVRPFLIETVAARYLGTDGRAKKNL